MIGGEAVKPGQWIGEYMGAVIIAIDTKSVGGLMTDWIMHIERDGRGKTLFIEVKPEAVHAKSGMGLRENQKRMLALCSHALVCSTVEHVAATLAAFLDS